MTADWLQSITDDPAVARLAARAEAGGHVTATGVAGSSAVLVAAALRRRLERPVLLVVAHLDDADEAADELEGLGLAAAKFPALEIIPGETSVNAELVAERLAVLRRLEEGGAPDVLVAPIAALMQRLPAAQRLGAMHRALRPGDRVDVDELVRWLDAAGWRRVRAVEDPGDFAVRGGILDVLPPGGAPARIDLFGDEIESLHEIDLDTMGSDRRVDRVDLVAVTLEATAAAAADGGLLPERLAASTVAMLADPVELHEQARSYLQRVADDDQLADLAAVQRSLLERGSAVIELRRHGAEDDTVRLPVRPLPDFAENVSEAIEELAELAATAEVRLLAQNDAEGQRGRELLAQFAPTAPVEVEVRYLHRGVAWERGGRALALVPYHELLHRYQTRRRARAVGSGGARDVFLDLQVGDYVVHRDHGIARFVGLGTLEGETGGDDEFLTLEFDGRVKLHVPAARIELVQKYIGAFAGAPALSTLGGRKWRNQKEKVADAVRDLAAEMLRLQASRESMPGIRFPDDTPWQREFEAEFPYTETDDQLAAITEVKRDMAGERPMDRLLCGDVGFGKTEVAIRAAFKAAEYGKQVAVLVPTTWLAEQHARTFGARFRDYPFRIEALSRFRTGAETREVLEALRRGQVDIVIGTHRLLSKDVRFADLGLVVIDEEQRFGVEHKQTLLAFRATADVLTMTATPIPRTLHMAMLGLRDISALGTPPLDRRAIVTEVLEYDRQRIARGIARELAREGQVFFVHNRVHDIESVADEVTRLAPGARVLVGHGQMPPRKLESVMRTFVRGEADILVSTTIIESGVDIPTANTMFVNHAHRFGLSELHQLRGRVGRHKHRAYCYLLLDGAATIKPEAMLRLRALESFSMLGAGFKIALRDLEIRGAGNLLGAEQSGHIAAVGYEMYCQLLEQAVAELRSARTERPVDTLVDLGITGAIPPAWIPSDQRRMDAYRRISRADDAAELARVQRDLESAYGGIPRAARRLLELAEVRIGAAALGVRTVTRRDDDIVFRTRDGAAVEARLAAARGTVRRVGKPDRNGIVEIYWRPPKQYLEAGSLLAVLRKRLAGGASQPTATARS